jgi:hypothetical protein
MKHLENGRNQRLAAKRKSNKPSSTKPSANRSRQVALRKKTRLDNLRKNEKILAKKAEAEAAVAAKAAVVSA